MDFTTNNTINHSINQSINQSMCSHNIRICVQSSVRLSLHYRPHFSQCTYRIVVVHVFQLFYQQWNSFTSSHYHLHQQYNIKHDNIMKNSAPVIQSIINFTSLLLKRSRGLSNTSKPCGRNGESSSAWQWIAFTTSFFGLNSEQIRRKLIYI